MADDFFDNADPFADMDDAEDYLRGQRPGPYDPDAPLDPVEHLGLRRSKHVGTQGTTGRASSLDPQPQPERPAVEYIESFDPPDPVVVTPPPTPKTPVNDVLWDDDEDDDDMPRGRNRTRGNSYGEIPAREPERVLVGSGAQEFDLPMPSARATARGLADPDPFGQFIIPLTANDMTTLRDQIAKRPLLYEELARTTKSTTRSHNYGSVIGLAALIGWLFAFAAPFWEAMLDAKAPPWLKERAQDLPERLIVSSSYEMHELAVIAIAMLVSIATAALIFVTAATALQMVLSKRWGYALVVIANVAAIMIVSVTLSQSTEKSPILLGMVLVVGILQRPMRAIGRAIIGRKRTIIDRPSAAAPPTKRNPGRAATSVDVAEKSSGSRFSLGKIFGVGEDDDDDEPRQSQPRQQERPAQESPDGDDSEEDPAMIRLLNRFKNRGDRG